MRYAKRVGAIIGVTALMWLLIGVVAAWQRGYFKSGETDCVAGGTIAVTVISGPLNFAGVNPKVTHSNTIAVFLEGMQPLGGDAHLYYDALIRQFQDDPQHVQHIQNVWGNPSTAAAAQSLDGKAAYVQLDLVGQLGEAQANESLDAVRNVVTRTPPPPSVKAWIIGPCHSALSDAPWRRHFAGQAPGQ
jgi:uncharacterized membrane protein YdfJ with MMPL/SSD domain